MSLTKVHNRMIDGAAVSVIDFGADNTGATDSTSAIQLALDSLLENSLLVFPAGKYLVSANLTKSSVDNITLTGYGAEIFENGASLTGVFSFTSCDNLTIKGFDFLATENNTYFQANSPSEERSFVFLSGCLYARLLDVTGTNKRRLATLLNCHNAASENYVFNGFFPAISGGQVANANSHFAITYKACNESTVSNGRVSFCSGGFLCQSTSETVSIRGVTGEEVQDAIVYISSGKAVTITGCNVFGSAGGGIIARGFNITVTGCAIYNTDGNNGIRLTGAGTSLDSNGANGYNLTATGNTLRDCKGSIIVGAADGYYPRDITITGNTIGNDVSTGNLGAIEINTNVGGIVCSNNIIRTSATDNGIVLTTGGSGTIEDVICANNFIEDVNGSSDSTRAGIRTGGTIADFTITGNIFKSINSTIGVRVFTASKGIVANNIYAAGVVVQTNVDGTTTDVLISGNKGTSLISAGQHCEIYFNDASVTGFPATSTTPLRRGLVTYSGGNIYMAKAESASADWVQIN